MSDSTTGGSLGSVSYSTISSWEASLPANAVASGVTHVAAIGAQARIYHQRGTFRWVPAADLAAEAPAVRQVDLQPTRAIRLME